MICAYKATITKSKVFLREYLLESDMSLYRLHEFLCSDLEYSLDQMVYFEALDKKGNPLKRYGLFDFGDENFPGLRNGDGLHVDILLRRYNTDVL